MLNLQRNVLGQALLLAMFHGKAGADRLQLRILNRRADEADAKAALAAQRAAALAEQPLVYGGENPCSRSP